MTERPLLMARTSANTPGTMSPYLPDGRPNIAHRGIPKHYENYTHEIPETRFAARELESPSGRESSVVMPQASSYTGATNGITQH